MSALNTNDLRNTLLSIDEEATLVFGELQAKMEVVVAGGCAFILREVTRRPVTHDIDVLEADSRLRSIMEGYPAVNGAIAAFSDSIPYGYEDRLEEILPNTRSVRFLVPSLEDLVVMKLYAWRPNDIADLTNDVVLQVLDWEKLEGLVYGKDEARASCLSNRRYSEMTAIYEQYKREHKEGGKHESDI